MKDIKLTNNVRYNECFESDWVSEILKKKCE